MEIIGAAALIALGIVLAAVLYGRARAAHAPVPKAQADPAPREPVPPERTAEVALREAELARREAELARREAELEGERQTVADRHVELAHELERVSGLSAARAKQILLK